MRVCGLKHFNLFHSFLVTLVTPYAGVWIETSLI